MKPGSSGPHTPTVPFYVNGFTLFLADLPNDDEAAEGELQRVPGHEAGLAGRASLQDARNIRA